MATYKKKGFKGKDKNEQNQLDDAKFETAEVFNTLEETATRSEQWIEKNSKPLFYSLIGVVVIFLAFLGYNKYIVEPNQLEASNELAFPRKHFDEAAVAGSGIDSLLNLGLEGADGKYGFLDIAESFSGTDEFLSKFNSDDEMLGPVSLGAIGDAFSDINQPEDALEYYEKAANKKSNEFTTPLFLYKAGHTAMSLKEYDKAAQLFTQIKEKYSKSDQGIDIDKFINAAKYAE
jgi:tetratricopeptide (TPR) repeat protein